MTNHEIHNKGRAVLFRSPVLEAFTKSHPLVIWGIYIPIISWLVYHGTQIINNSYIWLLVAFFGGMFAWTFVEYIIHRFVFHLIAESKVATRIIYVMHGNHHVYPRDKERLFMPPIPSLIIASILFLIFRLILGIFSLGDYVFLFFPGFMLGYLLYGSMHYAIHAFKPPFKWMKSLWRNHHLHHYKDEDKGFGVSTTLWDRVFGTMFPSSERRREEPKVL
ncbi:MAG: sterol desaturase family protein [Flavitalea sp.]